MNQCFFQAIAHIPLGSTVAIKYLGPFLVSALGRRIPRHLSFVALAAFGVVVMNRPGTHVSFVGIATATAAAAGAGW